MESKPEAYVSLPGASSDNVPLNSAPPPYSIQTQQQQQVARDALTFPQTQQMLGGTFPQIVNPQYPYPMVLSNPQCTSPQFLYPQAQYPMAYVAPQMQQQMQTPNVVINNSSSNTQKTDVDVNVNANANVVTKVVKINNHMELACFSFLCCFFPIGALAIYKACQVDSAIMNGDTNKALRDSLAAKRLAFLAVLIGVLSYVIIVIIFAVLITSH